MAKKDSLQSGPITPRLVSVVPDGYTEQVRNGQIVYVKQTRKPLPKTPEPVKHKPTKHKISGTPRKLPPPTPKPVEPDYETTEDVVYLEKKPDTIQKVQSLRTDLKREFPNGLPKGYRMYKVPDLTNGANYTNAKSVTTDDDGMPVVYDFNTNKYVRTGEPSIYSTMPVQNDTPTIQVPLKENELPTKYDIVPERLRAPNYNKAKVITPTVDTSVYEGFNDIGSPNDAKNDMEFQKNQSEKLAKPIPKKTKEDEPVLIKGDFAKGGVVSKIRGYYNGTTKEGVIGQNDPYADKRKEEEGKTNYLKGTADNIDTNKLSYLKGTADNIDTNKLSVAAGDLAVNQKLTGEQKRKEDVKAVNDIVDTGLSAIPVYGQIYALAIGASKIGRSAIPKDVNGNAKSSFGAGLDAAFTPMHSQAIDDVSKGNYGDAFMDMVGAGFYKPVKDHLEYDKIEKARIENKKTSLEKYNKLNQDSRQQQTIAARESGNLNPTFHDIYNTKSAKFDDAGNLTSINTTGYAKGGIVSKIKKMYSDGGKIEGKGTSKSDSIKAKVEEGSFVVPAENAELAKGIRKLYLKVPIKKANLKQDGGEPVKLSNGEHLFTPEENEYLESIGIDLEDLAPNAEHGEEEMAKGGLTSKKYLKGEKYNVSEEEMNNLIKLGYKINLV